LFAPKNDFEAIHLKDRASLKKPLICAVCEWEIQPISQKAAVIFAFCKEIRNMRE